MKIPAPKFSLFERVTAIDDPVHGPDVQKMQGTVIALDSYYVRHDVTRPERWMYVVSLPSQNRYQTFPQSKLESLGKFDEVSAHLSERPEISFDIHLDEDNSFAEGCFRLPNQFWQVFIFSKADVTATESKPCTWRQATQWEQAATGVAFKVLNSAKLDRLSMLKEMSLLYGHCNWIEVTGPDSIVMR